MLRQRIWGELHAWSSTVLTSESGVCLQYLPEFTAKTENRNNPLRRYFTVKSLTPVVGPEEEERLYCPVRSLMYYRQALKDRDFGHHRNLFRSLKFPAKPLSSNLLSKLIRETIKDAHDKLSDIDLPAINIRSYETRAMAASLNVAYNRSYEVILDYTTWKSHSVFTRFYLRDVAFQLDGLYSLGPVVVGGSVIT